MICPKCGAENPTRRIYCDACGAELDQSLEKVQASVDQEIKRDRIKANAKRVRWLLGFATLVFAVGFVFRKNFKDLPQNAVVAFVAAPPVELDDRIAPHAVPFSAEMPRLPTVDTRAPRIDHDAVFEELTQEAHRQGVVALRRKNMRDPLVGHLVGDLTFYTKEPGTLTPLPIYVSQIRRLRPVAQGTWEFVIDGRDDPIRISPPAPNAIQVRILVQKDGEEPTVQPVPLMSIEEIGPPTQGTR
jgi:hypothetical protein